MISDPESDSRLTRVTFTTTAADALINLEAAGLGWNATVTAYADTRRARGYSSGLLLGSLVAVNVDADDSERRVLEFEALPPEDDLESLGRLMAHDWNMNKNDETLILGALSYDGDLPPPLEAASETLRLANQAGLPNPFAAARAAENLAVLERSAPLLVWPMVICVFLAHLPASTKVVLDLSEDADQEAGDKDFTITDYPARYWEWATEFLEAEARLMGRLWSVLASFDSKLGREYWFARASGLLEQVVSSRRGGSESSQKRKGDALESLVEALLRTEEPELAVIEKNFRTAAEEVDILVANSLSNPFWVSQKSPIVLIECKNWSTRAGIAELRVFESKIKDRGALCRLGIFVSMSGFTKPFLDRLPRFQVSDGLIFAIDGKELASILSKKIRVTDWLRVEGIRHSLGGTTAELKKDRSHP